MAISKLPNRYKDNVFLNCPFDSTYEPFFHAIVFTIFDCGFVVRCTKESMGAQNRLEKIFQLIHECRLGIHDISRIELDKDNHLPRFNMPLELGLFLSVEHYDTKKSKNTKRACLVLDSEKYRYQKFISDLAGHDPVAHDNDPAMAIKVVRNWLAEYNSEIIPSGGVIQTRYEKFCSELPEICAELKLDRDDLIFGDYGLIVYRWIKNNPR